MKENDRYLELRKQLAELGRSFVRASTLFPSSYYEFVEADSPLSVEVWNQWISDNRTVADLQRQRWDIYPAGWAADHDDVFSIEDELEIRWTRNSGVLLSPPATLEAAQVELESLAGTGIKILLAIRDEVNQFPSLGNIATLPTLPDGHRGWLYLVRNTAEVSRCVNLNVEYAVFNIPRDRRSHFQAMRKDLAERRGAATHVTSPNDSSVFRVTPDIFSASANAISMWLQGTQAEPIEHLVCPGLPIPTLRSPDGVDEALDLLRGVNSRQDQKLPVPSVRKPKRKVGRPSANETQKSLDRRLYEMKAGKSYAELARDFNLSVKEVAKGIDRERKRRERRTKKKS